MDDAGSNPVTGTVSRWCAGEPEEWTDLDGEVVTMSPHKLCEMQRWHSWENLDILRLHASAEEVESWECACECHKKGNR